MNGEGVSPARVRDGSPDVTPPLAKLFVWAYSRRRQAVDDNDVEIQPLPSPILLNAQIQCSVCNEQHSLLLPRWRVCPSCCNWVCACHVDTMPWRPCPNCHLNLQDYVGGSSSTATFVVPDRFQRVLAGAQAGF